MAWNYGRVLVVVWVIAIGLCDQDRHSQKFVKIDVSKVNQRYDNESTTAAARNETTEATTVSTSTAQSSSTTSSETKKDDNLTTTSSTTTTNHPSSTTESPPFEQPKEGRLTKNVPSGYYCKCDLKINICDVNCCCDIDCSNQILKTFTCDEEKLDIDEYHHKEGLQSCEVQGGLFCLVGEHHDEKDGSFYDKNLKASATKHSWSDIFPVDANPRDKIASFYRVNDVLKLYNETSEKVESFTLPQSLANSECQIVQPIRFLQDQSTECLRPLEDLEAFTGTFLEQQFHVRYLRLPRAEIMEHCMDEDCFNSSVRYCNLSGRNCRNTNQTESVDDSDETWHCPRIAVEFHHNYTHLEGLHIEVFCGPMELAGLVVDTIWQKITVKFARQNENKFSRKVSGNLGYLEGKSLIVSNLQIPENDTAEERRTKKYMFEYFTNGTRLPDESFRLKLPKSRQNRCILDDQNHYPVAFGESSWNKCNYSPQSNVSSESNFTEICNALQQGISNLLLHGIRPQFQGNNYADSVNLFLSKYGNPVNRSADWIQLRTVNVINEKVTASWALGKPHFSCNNMLINVKYHFFHARIAVRNVPRQRVLREAEIVFGPRVNLQFALDEDIRVPIFVQVQFFDLTASGSGGKGHSIEWLLLVELILVILGLNYSKVSF